MKVGEGGERAVALWGEEDGFRRGLGEKEQTMKQRDLPNLFFGSTHGVCQTAGEVG